MAPASALVVLGADGRVESFREKPPDPRSVNPDLPDGLARVILRCMAKAPDERYQNAAELIEDLNGL